MKIYKGQKFQWTPPPPTLDPERHTHRISTFLYSLRGCRHEENGVDMFPCYGYIRHDGMGGGRGRETVTGHLLWWVAETSIIIAEFDECESCKVIGMKHVVFYGFFNSMELEFGRGELFSSEWWHQGKWMTVINIHCHDLKLPYRHGSIYHRKLKF